MWGAWGTDFNASHSQWGEASHHTRVTGPCRPPIEPPSTDAGYVGRETLGLRSFPACCSFFRFSLEHPGHDLVLRVGVPPTQTRVLAALADRAADAGVAR